ncbi:MAG: O-antigen ligase family protein [Patescibacteria group bacterium]|jgi:O-antigen ligase
MNLFSKLSSLTILLLIFTELFSLIAYLLSPLGPVAFFVILGAVLILSIIKLEYGFYALLAELFVGGHGHLFDLNLGGITVSIRMGLFLVLLVVWLFTRIKNKELRVKGSLSLILNSNPLILYSLLFITILLGAINGFSHNQPANVFFDANAWLYFALIFVFFNVINNKQTIENILQVLTGATTYLALKTISVLFLFSHNFAGIGGFFYKWLRDSGVGEITYISGTMFRIFFQSQLYCLIGFLIVLTILIANSRLKEWKKYLLPAIYLYLISLTIIISQSRSFWVGGAVAIFGLLIFSWWKFNFRIKKTALLIIILAVTFASQVFLIQLVSGNFAGNVIADRFGNLQGEAAGISRLNQLQPLLYNIGQQALFGYGFGKELTYQSNDPRILKTHPGGIYTTYAFEWGYLDIVLKLGLVGLLIYLALIGMIFYQGLKRIKNQESRIKNIDLLPNSYLLFPGLLLGLTALCITNIFSPYLNHPLGISYIMLVSTILNIHD